MILVKQKDSELCEVVKTESIEEINKYQRDGFKECELTTQPQVEEGQRAVARFHIKGEQLIQQWEIEPDKEYIERQIVELKAKIEASDYQIIKSYELSLIGEATPYDINALHKERQEIREKINYLESLL